MTSILFLDIDGVANSKLDHELAKDEELFFCSQYSFVSKEKIRRICEVFEGFNVVISSDWRRVPSLFKRLCRILEAGGLTVVGHTDTLGPYRSEEIRRFLAGKEFEIAVIVDDLDAYEVDPELPKVVFYKTDYSLGFTEEDADNVRAIINV